MKKTIGIFGFIALSAGVFFFTNTLEVSNSNDVDLDSLISLNTADAECRPYNWSGGKCLTLSQICVGDPGNTECDF
jgi:hypothetical protein